MRFKTKNDEMAYNVREAVKIALEGLSERYTIEENRDVFNEPFWIIYDGGGNSFALGVFVSLDYFAN